MISLAALVLALPLQNGALIETRVVEGDVYCDIQARDYPVHRLMQGLCTDLDLTLEGFEDLEDSPRVSVYLEDRELHVAVEYILGAAGLAGTVAADSIVVRAASLPFPEREHSLQAAEIAYLTALQRFPEGPEAVGGRMTLAEIALERGEREKAIRHFELLLEGELEESLEVEAHLRAGRLLIELEEWSRSMPHFQFVGNHEEAPVRLVAEARRELARAILMRGDARRALYMLQGLETAIDPLDRIDDAERKLLLARARIGVGQYVEALRDLEYAQRVGAGHVSEMEGMDLRARALELDGRPVQAALAWLHFSRGRSETVKAQALARAAEMALSVEGEELSVLFLGRHAEAEGVGDAVLPFVNEARARLGLESADLRGSSATERLERAVQHLDAGAADQAAALFALVEPELLQLTAIDRVRFASAFAPLVEERGGVEAAITLLRRTVATLEAVENRSRLYLVAGEILERHGRFEEAAAAYGGQL